MKRLLVLLALAGATLVVAPSSSAAIGPAQDAATRTALSEPGKCSVPCLVFYFKKGAGAGSVSFSPNGPTCTSDCSAQFGEVQVSLTAQVTQGVFRRWENCPNANGLTCHVPPEGRVYVCAVFDTATSTAPTTACPPYDPEAGGTPPPPTPPASPPPPPANPPRVGSRCTIPGTAGPNVINGTRGRDVICGRGGNDRINGRGGHDLIVGGSGRDRLTGGSGRDAIYGNSGNDTLSARDGTRDTVNGGRGRDRARWDARDVRRSIERRL